MTWLIVILGIIVVAIWMWFELPLRTERQDCIRKLHARDDVDLPAEFAAIAKASGIPVGDVERLWKALASFHDIPASKLRRTDRIGNELTGLFGHPGYDILMSPLFLADKEAAQKALTGVVTLEDLICVIYRLERERGMQATRRLNDSRDTQYQWIE